VNPCFVAASTSWPHRFNVGGPNRSKVHGVFRRVDCGPRRGVEDDVQTRPVVAHHGVDVSHVESGAVERDGNRELEAQRTAELAVRAEDDRGHRPRAE
jgi:hypothetical protein